MRRLTFYFSVLALPLLLAACEKDSSPDTDGGERVPLGIASLSAPGVAAQTRVTTTPLPTDGEVGFFVLADAPHYSAVNNKKGVYKADESLWLPVDSIWLANATAKLAVYYPYDAAQTTAGKLNLKAAVRTDDTKDLWSARFEANSRTKDLALTLTQLYSRLSVTFVKLTDVEYTGTAALTQIKLAGTGIYADATYDPQDGTYTYGTAGYTASLTGITIKGTDPAASDATKIDLLLPPYATLTGDITLTATVDTKEMKITIPKAKLSNTLAAGKQYNITVKLKPTALVLGSIHTSDWDSQTAFNAEAEMENPPIEFIDLGLYFLIAPGNLRAVADGTGKYKYAFAEGQSYYSGVDGAFDPAAGGDYFCWNDLEPIGEAKHPSWDDARDPCRKVGDGWYTPTGAQLQALIDAGYVWGTYTMPDGMPKSGCYYGTTAVPSKESQDQYVFLPAAGMRYDSEWNGSIYYSYYWSREVYDDVQCYCLDNSSSSIYFDYRECGFPIRCVKDKTIDIGLNFLIAPGNLIAATNDYAGTLSYAFAEGQGYYSGITGGGDYFCWNTLDPQAFNVTQSSWNETNDPCRKVGDGNWYTPTKAQLQALIDAGNVLGDGIYTMPDGTKKNGCYFGTTTPPLEEDQDRYVFLPAAGYRDYNEGSGTAATKASGTIGYYWSRVTYDLGDLPEGSYVLGCGYGSAFTTGNDRSRGFPVRCIRNKSAKP